MALPALFIRLKIGIYACAAGQGCTCSLVPRPRPIWSGHETELAVMQAVSFHHWEAVSTHSTFTFEPSLIPTPFREQSVHAQIYMLAEGSATTLTNSDRFSRNISEPSKVQNHIYAHHDVSTVNGTRNGTIGWKKSAASLVWRSQTTVCSVMLRAMVA